MTKRYRRGSDGKPKPLPCSQGGPHDFTSTLYVHPKGYVFKRKTCRMCLLTLTSEVRELRRPRAGNA